jgi:major membrane immunogen (membrane-anchored lipoprotein)
MKGNANLPQYLLYSAMILVLFLTNACGKSEKAIPDGVLNKEEMIAVFTDLRLAEGSYRVLSQHGISSFNYIDSTYQLIYKSHNIESWQVDSSLNYYSRHPKELNKIFKAVADNIIDLSLKKP